MKTIVNALVLSLILMAGGLMAQKKTDKADVAWGPEMTIKADGSFVTVLATSGNTSYLLMDYKKKRHIQRMDGTRRVWQKSIDDDKDMKGATIRKFALVGKDIVMLTSLYDKKNQENELFYSRFDQERFDPVVTSRRIAAIPAPKANNAGSFEIRVSPDHSKIMVHLYFPREKDVPRQSRVEMFDGDMNPLWTEELECRIPRPSFPWRPNGWTMTAAW